VTVPTGTATSAIAAYAAVPGVVFAEANLAQSLLSDAPNDPLLDDAYWVDRTDAVAGWAAYNATQAADFAPSGGATLAVLDSGIDLSHPEFARQDRRLPLVPDQHRRRPTPSASPSTSDVCGIVPVPARPAVRGPTGCRRREGTAR
jgi:hypothetical protein